MYTEKHLIELFNDHDYIQVILHSVLYKKQNLTGYIQYYKKMVDRHKGHGSERTTLPVWPNVRQKKKAFANSA